MSIELIVNGTSYPYPETDDTNWGDQATAWAAAISQTTLQKNGGLFDLTSEANFGSTAGLKTLYLKSTAAIPANTGVVRLGNSDLIVWRNSANTADLSLSVVGDALRFNNLEFVDLSSSQTLSNKVYNGTSISLGGGTALTTTNRTGTGNLVLATSPTLTTPVLGVATGTSLALGGGTALTTTNRTGTGNLVLATSPTLTTPVLGVATATSLNKVAVTAPATSATLTLANGSTLATSGAFSLTLTTTAATTVTFPTTGKLLSIIGDTNVDVATSVTPAYTSGADNLNLGKNAGSSLTTGYENLNIGTSAGVSLVGGFNNVNIGTNSGYDMVGAYENVGIGFFSGRKISSGYSNTLVGTYAGYPSLANAVTTGDNNTFIGKGAGFASTTQRSFAIAIGSGATVNADNTWVVGKLGTVQAIYEGTNACMGQATLAAGAVTVNTTKVTANSRIFLTPNVPGGTPGWVRVSARTAGTSFTITSSSGTDTSSIAWEIKEPA